MLSAYLETASNITNMSPIDFFSRYGEVSRILRHLDGSPDHVATEVFKLHQRHARFVTKVIDNGIALHATALREHSLPPSCLLRLVCDSATCNPEPITLTTPPTERETIDILGEYVFRRAGQAWQVRFAGGKEFILLPSKGAAYLQLMLSRPQCDHPVTELAYVVAREPTRFALGSAGEAADPEALSAYRARYDDLQGELNSARNNGNHMQETQIREEMAFLAEEIKRDKGLHGRLRKEADDRERIRKAFQAAIRRVVKEIQKYDKDFANHLKTPTLRCGWNPCYDPRGHIEWDTYS